MRPRFLSLLLLLPLAACTEDPLTSPVADTGFARLAGADQGGVSTMVTLSGDQEVPANESPATGTFLMTINPGLGILCYELTATDLTEPAAAAHIHRAPRGTNGGVVVPLLAPTTGQSSECLDDVDADLLREIRKDPAAFYVNVHNPAFPGGEIRAQLK